MNLYRISIGPRDNPRLVFEAISSDSVQASIQHIDLCRVGEAMRVTAIPREDLARAVTQRQAMREHAP